MNGKTTILLTGATGFLGRSILAELVAQGYRVVILVRDTPESMGRANHVMRRLTPEQAKLVTRVYGDVTDPAVVARSNAQIWLRNLRPAVIRSRPVCGLIRQPTRRASTWAARRTC